MTGVEDGGSMGNKTVVKIDKTDESLEILRRGQRQMSMNGINMKGEGSDASGSDSVTKKKERGLGKGALVQIDQEAVGTKDVQNGGEMSEVNLTVKKHHFHNIQPMPGHIAPGGP